MNLNDVISKWNSIKEIESTLEKQLEENRAEQIRLHREIVDSGFVWADGKWVEWSESR